jgi:hypothetical protein
MKSATPGWCVICGKRIESTRVELVTKSDQHPERTYRFSAHLTCLKKVAKPGFAGIADLSLSGQVVG